MKSRDFTSFLTALLLLLAVAGSSAQSFPTQPPVPGGAGTPGTLDTTFRPVGGSFVGNPDIRCATVQTDGKIVIGGTFQLRTSIPLDLGEAGSGNASITYRNLARLNADGTLDKTFLSPSAYQIAAQQYNPLAPPNITWGPDGAVYSILVTAGDDLYSYVVTGDFLNFSHDTVGNSVPRKRYLVLQTLPADPFLPTTTPQQLVNLTNNVANGDGFNGAVRKFRRLYGSIATPDIRVPDLAARLLLRVRTGTIVLQLDNGFIYQKISSQIVSEPDDQPTIPADWIVLPGGRRVLDFAAGDFTSFANSSDERYITRGILAEQGFALSIEDWVSPPNPNRRVWDMAALGSQIIFVGEFDTVGGGQTPWRKIASISENGTLSSASFNPGSGFNGDAYAVAADPVTNSVVVGGAFTDYDGVNVGRLARVNSDGSLDPSFPQPNNGNTSGANGPVRVVVRQPDGRLYIAGEFTTYNGVRRSGVARIEADGSLDLTFLPAGDASGIQAFANDFDGGPGSASLFARPVAVGNFRKLFKSNFTGIARFVGGSYPVVWFQPDKINAPHAFALGAPMRLDVVASDNFVGYPGFTQPPFETPQPPSEPLLYQWQRNGVNLPGEVTASLEVASMMPGNAGTYRVRIYNSQFSIFSQPVQVTTINPFAQALPSKGARVTGIIEPSSILNGGLGGTIDFQLNRLGFLTGTLTLGNISGAPTRYRFSGQYNYDGGLVIQIPRPNQPPLFLSLRTDFQDGSVSLDFSGPDNYLDDGSGQVAQISAWNIQWTKAAPAADYAGTYNVALETDPGDMGEIVGTFPIERPMVSQGWGFLTMKVAGASGRCAVAGVLSDGTRFTAASTVWGDFSGTVPFWSPLYGTRGSLTGRLGITAGVDGNPVQAELVWTKPAGVLRSPDAYGFTNVGLAASPGSGLYSAAAVPPSFVLALDFNDFNWQGIPGALANGPFFQTFTVTGSSVRPDVPNDQEVRLSFNSRSGTLGGSFRDPDAFGALRNANFRAIGLTADGAFQTFGFFLMPNTAKSPEFIVGGGVSGF